MWPMTSCNLKVKVRTRIYLTPNVSTTAPCKLQQWDKYRVPHRRQRVVVEDRSVAPEWPRVVDLLHRSAGGVLLLSLRSWSIHRLLGRPGRRFQLWSGRWPRVRSTWHQSAWWAGVSSESLAMWPKTEFWWREMRSDTGPRPVRAATSEFHDVILPTDLGYLALALHVESLQTSFIGSEYAAMSRRRTEERVIPFIKWHPVVCTARDCP